MVTASPRNYPAPVFMGFCLKEYWPTPADWKSGWSAGVVEVCSASECIASRPPHWIDGWDFNRASCWNDEAAAWARVPPDERDNYRLYAYRAFPLVFDISGVPKEQQAESMFLHDLPDLPSEPDLSDYARLGYDVVEYGFLNYGCSPLACNEMGAEYPVNRYCLIDDLDAAYRAAVAFGKEEPEPGPFIIIEVLRKGDEGGPQFTMSPRC